MLNLAPSWSYILFVEWKRLPCFPELLLIESLCNRQNEIGTSLALLLVSHAIRQLLCPSSRAVGPLDVHRFPCFCIGHSSLSTNGTSEFDVVSWDDLVHMHSSYSVSLWSD